MLNYVHQLVAYFVCLLFGAEQVVCSRFLELCHWKQLWGYESGVTEPKHWAYRFCKAVWSWRKVRSIDLWSIVNIKKEEELKVGDNNVCGLNILPRCDNLRSTSL